MATEASPIVVATAKLTAYSEAKQALVRSRADLSLAMCKLVGNRVVIEGYPSGASFIQAPDPETGQPRNGISSIYGTKVEPRLTTCQGEILSATPGSIVIGVESAPTTIGGIVSYVFNITNLVRLEPVETRPE